MLANKMVKFRTGAASISKFVIAVQLKWSLHDQSRFA
jgi:hypothetical protein